MASYKIQETRNYALFERSDNNRETNVKKRRMLLKSMKTYGFIPGFPVVVKRVNGKLVVKDGQHRLALAESLGIPVYWIEIDIDFDIGLVNSAPEKWCPRDYAHTYAKKGSDDYRDVLEFAGEHGLPIGTAACLLAGTTTFGNIEEAFKTGGFCVKDRDWADTVASIYAPLVGMSKSLKNARFVHACMKVTRVSGFDAKRLVQGASKCRDKLVAFSTTEAYVAMLEELYNYKRSNLFGLKVASEMAMRDRSPAGRKAAAVAVSK